MENTNGKSRASFQWMLLCTMMGLALSVSPYLAQGNRDVSQEMQHLRAAPPCDSLEVCWDIYRRLIEQAPEYIPDKEPWNAAHIRVAPMNRDALQEMQRVWEMQRLFGVCDSLMSEPCLGIYRRFMQQAPERIPNKEPWDAAQIRVAPIPPDLDKLCRGTGLPESACSSR
jgi:hypothetical protein